MSIMTLRNFVGGRWHGSDGPDRLEVTNPATAEVLASVPMSSPAEVDQAARSAAASFVEWRRVPAPQRIQYLFKLKQLLEEHFEDLARTITMENGKVLDDARGNYGGQSRTWRRHAGFPS